MTTTTCNTCRDRKVIYCGWSNSTGYHPCPDCQPAEAPLHDWVTPMGYDERIQGDGEGGRELVED